MDLGSPGPGPALGGTSQIYVNVFPGSTSSSGFSVVFIPSL